MSECFGKNHFFALFGLPVAFEIDKDLLKQNLLNLQKKYHPDSQTQKSADLSQAPSSELINQAYQTLYHDELRAIYLLEIAGLAVNLDNSIDDIEFLSLMMDSRIALEESACSDEIAQVHANLDKLNRSLVQEFAVAYQTKEWQTAQTLALKLKFLAKLKNDTQKVVISDDDDEALYV